MASLPNWVQGARRPSMLITWMRDGTSTPEDLTGATITGLIKRGEYTTITAAITGTLALTDADGGVFRWDLSAADVEHYGNLEVQFTATFGSGQTPAKTFKADWRIERALVVSA
jgi:hypothetical protein